MAFSDAFPDSGGQRVRLPGKRLRRPAFLLGMASVLVFALVMAYTSMGSSQAANASMDVRWQPENINVVQDGSNCSVTVNGNVAGTISMLNAGTADVRTAGDTSAEHAADISQVMHDITPRDAGQPSDQFGNLTITAQVPSASYMFPAGVSMAVDCAALKVATMTELQAAGTVRTEALPTWSKGAVAAVAGAAVYLAVSIAVTAAVVALGYKTVPAKPMKVGAAAIASMAGCIGGSTSNAVTLALAGAGTGWQATLANLVAGCITGGAIALLPIKDMGAFIGTAIRSMYVGGDAAAAIGGVQLVDILVHSYSSNSSVSPLSQRMSEILAATADAAESVR